MQPVTKNLVWGKNWSGRTSLVDQNWSNQTIIGIQNWYGLTKIGVGQTIELPNQIELWGV